jgi:antitoxin (DNA-binding transcriptional repressor) of toxin-antitoxin stability system
MSRITKDQPQQPRRVGVREFRGNLTSFLQQARHGASFLITSHDDVVAEIRPPSPPDRGRREPGSMRGRIHMAPDFDTTPPDIIAAMEGDEV